MVGKAGILQITNYLKQNNTLDACETSKKLVRSLEQIEETYTESAIEDKEKAKEEIKTYMVTQLQGVLSGICKIGEEMTDELYDDLLENIEAISEIAEAHCIDEISREDLKKTSELLSQSSQQTIKAPQAVRETQDNSSSQEPSTGNEQQYNQDMINAATEFADRHKGERGF